MKPAIGQKITDNSRKVKEPATVQLGFIEETVNTAKIWLKR